MYFDDHPPPHIHASYQGQKAFIAIETGKIVIGKLPKKAANLVRQWALDHHDELMANWHRGVALMPMEMISGADNDN